MKKRFLALFLAFALFAAILPAGAVSAGDGVFHQDEARSMLALVNDFRTGPDAWYYDESGNMVSVEGLQPLSYDYALEWIAMQRAVELTERFEHTRPNGEICFTLTYNNGQVVSYGENIAYGYGAGDPGSMQNIFTAWQETNEPFGSQGHRRNMLSVDYPFMSIGISCFEYNGVKYWVQEFGYENSGVGDTLSGGTAQEESPTPAPTAEPTPTPEPTATPELTATPEPTEEPTPQPSASSGFPDVDPGSWYESSVIWALDNGITAGYPDGGFHPSDTCTRAQIVTFLYKAFGSPSVSDEDLFFDVSTSDYFYDPATWAAQNGITSGVGDGAFAPGNPCTRGQVVAMLYRAAGSPGYYGENPFYDLSYDAYYYDAAIWASEAGVVAGYPDGGFYPEDVCTRAQIVRMLHSYFTR